MSSKFNEKASAVVAVLIMVSLTVILMGTLTYFSLSYTLSSKAPFTKIEIIEAKGTTEHLYDNEITLIHKGGDVLYAKNVKIIIRGTGREALKSVGHHIGDSTLGSIEITYENLEGYGYYGLNGGTTGGKLLRNGVWYVGDVVMLNGTDGGHYNSNNSVDKKWELKPDTTVKVTIIDKKSNHIIAKSSSVVKEND